jgi:alkanesulfonate monooxygenase SsuD/methylene tetrahydromethanopterin reductase-like flavin-dependent oxidoreductase (luciferase family)
MRSRPARAALEPSLNAREISVVISLGLPAFGAYPDDPFEFFVSIAERADASEVDTVWISDHLIGSPEEVRANGGQPGADEPFDAWTVLAMLAARTSRVRVGTVVTPLPLRHPVLLAQTVASLHSLSSGRVVLGVGGGWNRPEFDGAGLPFGTHAQRMLQTRDGTQLIRRLLAGETVSTAGTLYPVKAACVRAHRSERPPEIWLGGSSDAVLRLVADSGDGWIATTNASPEQVAHGRDRLHVYCDAVGRDPDDIAIGIPLVARVAETTDEARADIEQYLERGRFKSPVKEFLGEATRKYGVWGSPEECVTKLERYRNVGVEHVILQLQPPDHAHESAQLICDELIPRLAEAR